MGLLPDFSKKFPKKICSTVFVFLLAVAIVEYNRLLSSTLFSGPALSQTDVVLVTPRTQQDPDVKTILLWNPFFGEPDYGIGGFGTAAFNNTHCTQICSTTNNKSELYRADAVVIHSFNVGPFGQNITLPTRAHDRQIFVFFILESPVRSMLTPELDNIFNLTFTFLEDADTDIAIPLGGARQRPEIDESKLLSLDRIRKKKYAVAWLVSNCSPISQRNAYAEELSKYIDVHIYGKCGSYVCPPMNFDCYYKISTEYFFYLSFENSYCADYATEKLYRTLETELVPIVYGGGNYTRLLPEKSVIDVRDFTDPKSLALYLKSLQDDPEKYQEYFAWKQHYEVLQEGDYKAKGFCRLCEILNTPDYQYKSEYRVRDYWSGDTRCLRGEAEKQAVHLPL